MDVEGVEGGFGGVGDGEAGCVERGGHGGDAWQGGEGLGGMVIG